MWDLEICGLSHEYPKYLDFQWLPQHLHSHTKLWKWFLEVFTFIFTFKQPQTYRTAHIRTIWPHSQISLYCLSWNKNWSQLQDNVTAEKYFKVFFGIFWFLVPNLLRPSRENPLKLDKIRNWLYKVGWFITQILNFKYKHNKKKIESLDKNVFPDRVVKRLARLNQFLLINDWAIHWEAPKLSTGFILYHNLLISIFCYL